MSRRAGLVVALAATIGTACDRFDRDAGAASSARPTDPRVRARDAITTTMKAAEVVTRTCTATDLVWEEEATEEPGPKHYSRPCLPERCAPRGDEIEALREATFQAKQLLGRDPALQVPSIVGVVSLADAMVKFIDASTAAAPRGEGAAPPDLSGLSMHYGALVSAFAKLYPEPVFPQEPPSLTASLAADGVGGDVCKGWGNPKLCDVVAIEVPKQHRWRTSPACVEVDSVKKPK